MQLECTVQHVGRIESKKTHKMNYFGVKVRNLVFGSKLKLRVQVQNQNRVEHFRFQVRLRSNLNCKTHGSWSGSGQPETRKIHLNLIRALKHWTKAWIDKYCDLRSIVPLNDFSLDRCLLTDDKISLFYPNPHWRCRPIFVTSQYPTVVRVHSLIGQ